jgi:nitrogen fixation/metabolism regulation signal transduction histidine kinase
MAEGFKTGGFEKRLLVFFLLLSVTPTLLIAILGGRYFFQSFERVGSPALRESARSSMEIARKLEAKLDQDAHAASRCLADEYRALGARPGAARLTRLLETVRQEHRVDFVGLYTLEGTSWKLAMAHPDTVARIDSVMGIELVSPRDDPQRILFEDEDAIVSGTTIARDTVFVAGFILDAGTMEMMRNTAEDLSRYSAMPLYARSQGIFLIFVITATVVIMVIASLIVSRLIAKRISHPITELAIATERVARGDLDHRVTVTARDEIQDLITAFNRMTEDLQEYKRSLVRAERIAAWRDVARRIAHEIKNPLQPIMNAI